MDSDSIPKPDDSRISMGILTPEEKTLSLDDSDNIVRENKKDNRLYKPWEMRIFVFEEAAAKSPPVESIKYLELIISNLLVLLSAITPRDETTINDLMTKFEKLPSLGEITILPQGEDYQINDIANGKSLNVPREALQIGVNLVKERQAYIIERQLNVLKTKIMSYIREKTGYFSERGVFNVDEYIRLLVTTPPPSYTSMAMGMGSMGIPSPNIPPLDQTIPPTGGGQIDRQQHI